MLKLIKRWALLVCLWGFSLASVGAKTDPLFISLTSNEPHRVTMALSFGKHHAAQGHPLSLFLSDKGVYVGIKGQASQFPEQQNILREMMANGAVVIMCPLCLKHYGFTESDLLPGITMGGAKVTGAALFKENTKTLSW